MVVTRYFLNMINDQGIFEDPDGSDCENLEGAKSEAVRGLRESLADAIDADTTR